MKAAVRKFKRKIKLIKLIKKQAGILTETLPCVNLYVKAGLKSGIKIYNNDDFVAQLTIDEALDIMSLGALFFSTVLYCLCLKNSILKYF